MNQIQIPNIEFTEISLINTVTKAVFRVYPRPNDEPYIFDKLVFNEDMFSESVSGTLIFNDVSYFIDQLNLSSFDIVQISLISNGQTKSHTFKVVEIIRNANLASKSTLGPAGAPIPTAVKFSSDQVLYKNFNSSLIKSFIGKIAGNINSETSYLNVSCPQTEMPGFVEYIFETFGRDTDNAQKQKSVEIDPTFNSLWVKVNPSYYPWSKLGSELKISQLMNYVCEYACYEKNQNAVNYFFWEDLDKFNFRCIESLIDENNKNNSQKEYTPSINEYDENAILSIEMISEAQIPTLIANGAFSGEYVRIIPNWDNPYRAIVDTADSTIRTQIIYDYWTDKNNFKQITKYPPIDKNKNLDMSLAYAPNRISDSNYGYFQNAYSQKQTPWWNYWDPAYKGYDGFGGGNTDVDRIEENYWQAQFDFSELPGSCLKKIYEQIKWPKNSARANYASLKRNKTKWEFYKNTILGERNMPTSFYAVLTSATKIYSNGPGGIWRYGFKEIEFFEENRVNWYHLNSSKVIDPSRDVQNRDYPFEIRYPKWGLEGAAYNLNEFLNGTLPADLEQGDGRTALLSPGISAKVDVTNSGAVKSDSAYPGSFRMRPVGEFYVRSRPDDNTDTSLSSVYVGRIVKVEVVDSIMLDTMFRELNSCGSLIPSTGRIYIFDVENSHDGVCSNGE